MIEILFTCGLVVFIGAVAMMSTRASVLARIARANDCLFEKQKETVTTPFAAGRLDFFIFFFHQFRHVFTYVEKSAFIRVADDYIYKDENPKTKPLPVTIFAAELKNGDFLPLKVVPVGSVFASSKQMLIKTNNPAIDAHYQIAAPSAEAGALFTPLVMGFLKTHHQVYLELNGNALVYHEHALVPASQIEAFRFRAMQLLRELETHSVKQEPAPVPSAEITLVSDGKTTVLGEETAAALLQMASGRIEAAKRKDVSFGRFIGLSVMLLLLLGFGFLSWWILRGWMHY